MRNLPAPNSGWHFATSTADRDCCSASPHATGCCISAPADAPGIRRTMPPRRRWHPTNILPAGFCEKPACRRSAVNISSCMTATARIVPAGHERDDALDCFRRLGGSAFVKPLTGSRGDFAQAVHGEAALVRYLDEVDEVLRRDPDPADRRGNRVPRFPARRRRALLRAKISAVRAGDGVHTVRELLAAHNDALRARGLSPASLPNDDPSLDAVPAKGERREIPGRMNLSAGGTMVLADCAIRKGRYAGAAGRPRARTSRRGRRPVRRYRRRSGCDRDHRSQFQPVDPAAGRFRSRRPDPEDLASHLFRHGIAVVFDLPKYGDGICLARMAELLEALGSRSRAAAAHLGGGDRLERQGQHGGVLRRHRPRLWPANRPVHLAASLSFQRTDSGRRRRDRRRRRWRA